MLLLLLLLHCSHCLHLANLEWAVYGSLSSLFSLFFFFFLMGFFSAICSIQKSWYNCPLKVPIFSGETGTYIGNLDNWLSLHMVLVVTVMLWCTGRSPLWRKTWHGTDVIWWCVGMENLILYLQSHILASFLPHITMGLKKQIKKKNKTKQKQKTIENIY